MSSPNDRWLDRQAGPVVRLYAVTRGRTRPAGYERLDLIDVIQAAAEPDADFRLGPEQRRILARCARPVSVAEVASDVELPVGVVRVLLGDLIAHGLLTVCRPAPDDSPHDERLLRKVLDGLKTL